MSQRMMPDRPRQGGTVRSLFVFSFGWAAILSNTQAATAADPHPLRPADTASPRATENMPNVATNGGNRSRVMTNPFTKPQSPPARTPVNTATNASIPTPIATRAATCRCLRNRTWTAIANPMAVMETAALASHGNGRKRSAASHGTHLR